MSSPPNPKDLSDLSVFRRSFSHDEQRNISVQCSLAQISLKPERKSSQLRSTKDGWFPYSPSVRKTKSTLRSKGGSTQVQLGSLSPRSGRAVTPGEVPQPVNTRRVLKAELRISLRHKDKSITFLAGNKTPGLSLEKKRGNAHKGKEDEMMGFSGSKRSGTVRMYSKKTKHYYKFRARKDSKTPISLTFGLGTVEGKKPILLPPLQLVQVPRKGRSIAL